MINQTELGSIAAVGSIILTIIIHRRDLSVFRNENEWLKIALAIAGITIVYTARLLTLILLPVKIFDVLAFFFALSNRTPPPASPTTLELLRFLLFIFYPFIIMGGIALVKTTKVITFIRESPTITKNPRTAKKKIIRTPTEKHMGKKSPLNRQKTRSLSL